MKEKEVWNYMTQCTANTKNRSWLGEVFYMPIHSFFCCNIFPFNHLASYKAQRSHHTTKGGGGCSMFETISTDTKCSANNIAKKLIENYERKTI